MTWIAARGLSGAEALGRCTGISRLHFCAACGQPRKLLRTSSGAKSRGPKRVPASRPTTFKPAAASGSTATPPAPPRPTTTTSARSSLVAIALARARVLVELRVVVSRALKRLELRVHALLLGGHREPQSRITDELPADELAIATVVRIAERPFERVTEHELEERARRRRETGRAILLEIADEGVLPLRRERGERAPGARARVRVESRKARGISRPLRGQRVAQCAVDVARGAGLERARTVRVARDQPRHERFERGGFRRRQIRVWRGVSRLREHVCGDCDHGAERRAAAQHLAARPAALHRRSQCASGLSSGCTPSGSGYSSTFSSID